MTFAPGLLYGQRAVVVGGTSGIGAATALRLRRYDDRAKTPGAATPPLAHYAGLMHQVAKVPGTATPPLRTSTV